MFARLGRVVGGNGELAIGAGVIALLVVLALYGRIAPPYNPDEIGVGGALDPPLTAGHLLGTDALGRDILARLAAGTGVTLTVGISTAVVACLIGVVVGGAAAFMGGLLDDLLMRITEVFLIIPAFFLAIVLLSLYGPSVANLIITISLLSWPVPARVVRSEVLTLKTRPFVDAVRVAGLPERAILVREIVPNVLSPLLITGGLLAGHSMLLEAALSYLGLGDPNEVSLGVMLQESQAYMQNAWWAAVLPGLVLFIAIFAINLVSDGLRRRLDPRNMER
jgi:peptide/nickel transport system permease protein